MGGAPQVERGMVALRDGAGAGAENGALGCPRRSGVRGPLAPRAVLHRVPRWGVRTDVFSLSQKMEGAE